MNKVKESRLMIGMSQEKLAASIPCSRETIRNIESGKTIPGVMLAIRIGKVLGFSVEYLFDYCSQCEGTKRTVRYGRKEEGEDHLVYSDCSRCSEPLAINEEGDIIQ